MATVTRIRLVANRIVPYFDGRLRPSYGSYGSSSNMAPTGGTTIKLSFSDSPISLANRYRLATGHACILSERTHNASPRNTHRTRSPAPAASLRKPSSRCKTGCLAPEAFKHLTAHLRFPAFSPRPKVRWFVTLHGLPTVATLTDPKVGDVKPNESEDNGLLSSSMLINLEIAHALYR